MPSYFFNSLVLALLLAGIQPAAASTFTIPQLSETADKDAWFKVSVMSRIGHVGIRNDPTGEAELRLGWNTEALRIFIKVYDPDRFESGDNSLYRGDSVELFVAPKAGAPDFLQIVAAPGIAGSKDPAPRSTVVGYGAFKGQTLPVEVAGGPEKEGYSIEIIIPWKDLKFAPEKDREFGFQLVVNDRDQEPAKTGDYTKRNNEISHICWFPDRTTAFDSSRMQTLRLGATAGTAVTLWADPEPDFSSLLVDAPFDLAGKTLTVTQGSDLLGQATLAPDQAARLSTAAISLKQPNPDGSPLELRNDGQTVGRVALYAKPPDPSTTRRIVSTGDEKERLELLRRLQTQTADSLLQEDILTLLPLVESWACGRELAEADKLTEPSEYLSSTVNPMSPPAIRRDSPLFPLYCLCRARNLVWRSIEGGYPDEVAENFGLAHELLTKARAAAPNNPLVQMYLGEPQPWPGPPEDPHAPAWANSQRHALEKLTEIVHWWIDERQMPDGSYGGGWNDDVEMWRNWWPVMLAFEDQKAEAAQARLSSAIFKQPHMTAGYSSIMEDVEHSSEDSADSLTPMLYLRPDDAVWRDKAKNIARFMRDLWTAKNDQGHLAFRNIVFNSAKAGKDSKNAYDTTLDSRAVQPAFVYWQMTRDPELTPLFSQWQDTWVAAAESAQNGKPAGVLPAAIHFPDQRIGGPNKWWDTEGYSFLYNWPEYVGDMLYTLAITSHLTSQDKYLEPIRSMANIRLEYLARHPETARPGAVSLTSYGRYWENLAPSPGLAPGSSDWCAVQMASLLAGPVAGYRLLTGDRQFDELLRHDGDGYERFLLSGERRGVEEDLASVAASFSSNRPAYTSEVRWTDRLFRFTSAYLESFSKQQLPLPNTRLLYETLTGDPSTWVGCRLAAVRWHTQPKDIAALVTQTGKTGFKAELYHFGKNPREFSAELLLLQDGRYEATLRTIGATPTELSRSPLTVTGPGATVRLTLPPATLCEVAVVVKQ